MRPFHRRKAESTAADQLFRVAVVLLFTVISPLAGQFFNLEAFRIRLPGRCQPGYFDCGRGQCVHLRCFHDGKPDCWDGSDEYCFPGHIKCGTYCVELSYLGQCLANSRCNGATNEPSFCRQTKEKICREELALPCKGYGECVLWSWARDEKRDCLDGSDLDGAYMELLQSQWIHVMPTSASSMGLRPDENMTSSTFVPSLGGAIQPSLNASDHTPVLIIPSTTQSTEQQLTHPAPATPSPTLTDYTPTPQDTGFKPQPIVPVVKIQTNPMGPPATPASTSPPSPPYRPLQPIPASGLIPLAPPPPPPMITHPPTTPKNPFGEPLTTSEETFFGSAEHTPEPPIDYPEEYTEEVDGTVVPHHPSPPRPPTVSQPRPEPTFIYPVFVGQGVGVSPIQPTNAVTGGPYQPIVPPMTSSPYVYPPPSQTAPPETIGTSGTTPTKTGSISTGPTTGIESGAAGEITETESLPTGTPPIDYPYAPTMYPDRVPSPSSNQNTKTPYQPYSIVPLNIPGTHTTGPSPFRPPPFSPHFPYPPQTSQTTFPTHAPIQINPVSTSSGSFPHPPSPPYYPPPVSIIPQGGQPSRPPPFVTTGGYKPVIGTIPYQPPYSPYPQPTIGVTAIVPQQPTPYQPGSTPGIAPTGTEPSGTEEPASTAEPGGTESPNGTEQPGATTEQVFIPLGTVSSHTSTTTHRPTTTEEPAETSTSKGEEDAAREHTHPCTSHEIDKARHEYGQAECSCPPGQSKSAADQECQDTGMSSVLIDIDHICGDDQSVGNDDRALVAIREIRQAFDYTICIRDISYLPGKMLADIDCGGRCTIEQMNHDYKESTGRLGLKRRPLVFEEIPGEGVCSSASYHNCEEPSVCSMYGLQWQCRCPQGFNDTTGEGRYCIRADGRDDLEIKCIELFGMCLIWWFLLLFASIIFLLFLCCLAWILAQRYCCPSGYKQTKIRVPKTVKIKPADENLPHIRGIMGKTAKGSALRSTLAIASSKTMIAKRRSNLVLPGGSSTAIDIVSSDEENMGIPKPVIDIVGTPPLNPPVTIDIEPPTRSESMTSVRDMVQSPPLVVPAVPAPQPPSPVITGKPPTPPPVHKASIIAGTPPIIDSRETPILDSSTAIVQKPGTPPRQSPKNSLGGRKTPTPPTVSPNGVPESPSSIYVAVPLPVDIAPDSHLTVVPVEVHHDPDEAVVPNEGRDRSSSIQSVAGLPTIWDSYKVLGDQYAHFDGGERRDSTHSLDNAFNRRFPEHFIGPILSPPLNEEQRRDIMHRPDEVNVQQPPFVEAPPGESVIDHRESAHVSPGRVELVSETIKPPDPVIVGAVPLPVEVFLEKEDTHNSTDTAKPKTSREEIRRAQLAEMLGVEESEQPVRKTSGFMDSHDSDAIEEISRRGMQIEIPMLDTSQLDTASTTPRSTARGLRGLTTYNTPAARSNTHARGSERGNSKERSTTTGVARQRLTAESSDTIVSRGRYRGANERTTVTRSRSREESKRGRGLKKVEREPTSSGAYERLSAFKRQQESIGRSHERSRSKERKQRDKSYRDSGREVIPAQHTSTGLFAARSPEHSFSRPSPEGLSRRGASYRPVGISRSVESRRPPLPPPPKKPFKPRGRSSPPATGSSSSIIRKKPQPRREDSQVERAFFKRLDEIKEHKASTSTSGIEIKGKPLPRTKRPERQLSSISEKSAEISSDYALKAAQGDIKSAPGTTRRTETSMLLSSPSKRRPSPRKTTTPASTTIIEKKLILETIFSNEGTDVDMPLTSRHESVADLKGIVIIERKTEYSSDSMDPVVLKKPPRRPPIAARSQPITPRNTDSFLPSIVSERTSRPLPRPSRTLNTSLPSLTMKREQKRDRNASNDSSSATSSDFPTPPAGTSMFDMRRGSQLSTIRKKIKHRQVGSDFASVRDLRSISRARPMDTSKSVENLCEGCQKGDKSSRTQHGMKRSGLAEPFSSFLPNIESGRGRSRSVTTLPENQSRIRTSRLPPVTARHSSLMSLQASRTHSSMELSPYFDRIRDSKLPPKENLWWGAHV